MFDENGRIEWHITATLAQQFNYAQYPFDSQRITIIIARNLLNALIIYLLPLLVVIFSLFAIFCATGRIGTTDKVFVSLRGYTALLFALLVLHRTLRAQYPTGDVLYIEYLFFYTYLTILLVIVHGAIVQARIKQETVERISPILKSLFWPVQLVVWFITTVVIFY